MKLAFHKYHGTGNDFILIDNREGNIHLSEDQIAFLCNRHLGIGADGLICLTSVNNFDFGMVYYNADGKDSTLCGNGGRCIVAFAHSLGLIENRTTFSAIDGKHEAEILEKTGSKTSVKLKMSDLPASSIQSSSYPVIQLNTGSPHLVIFVDDISVVDVIAEGRKICHDKQFSQDGTNVDFVEVMEDKLFVRTYERGVEDETLSCGTGVTAAALVYANNMGQRDKGKEGQRLNNPGSGIRDQLSPIIIKTMGGTLTVSFQQHESDFTNIWLEGPVEFVFSGQTPLHHGATSQ